MNSNEDILKEKRAKLLNDLINKIKDTIKETKMVGEKSSKIDIYNRISDYTFYSEVSIRKFLTGAIPKDISSFLEGIVAYCKLIKMDENYLENFVKEYTLATNVIILHEEKDKTTKNNLIPQDFSTIVRPKKLTDFIYEFLKDDVNLSYIYGYNLSGKTKSVMACATDISAKNYFDNIIWINLKEKNQKEELINSIFNFFVQNRDFYDESNVKEFIYNKLRDFKTLIIIDFEEQQIEEDVFEFIKEILQVSKIIIITSNPYKKYAQELDFYCKAFCTNFYINTKEFEEILRLNTIGSSILNNIPNLVDSLYSMCNGQPFIGIYILKRIIEDNQLGIQLSEAIDSHINKKSNDLEELSKSIILSSWKNLSLMAKKILIICSKFKVSISCKFITYVLNTNVEDSNWKIALKELYNADLITGIILNNPRINTNNIIKTLISSLDQNIFDEEDFITRIAEYYEKVSENIGECYNNIEKLKFLDDLDEFNVIIETLEYLEKEKRYKDYINIVRNLKYYIYVRGMWNLGDESIHLKRYRLAKEIDDRNEELEALCDYINICSKSKNKEEAKKYIDLAENEILNDVTDKRILCLFYHVKALYLYNCLEEYEKAYNLWIKNKENYFEYINEYRKLVNLLWEDRCYCKLEKDLDKVYNRLIIGCENAKEKNFIRGIIDYELLIANNKIEKYEITEDINNLKLAKNWLEIIQMHLDSNNKDIRNEAFFYKLKAIVAKYEKDENLKNEYGEKAIDLYKLMNCNKDIDFLTNI